MLKYIKKFLPIIDIGLLLLSILVLIADTIIYPGIVRKHIFIDSISIAFLSSIVSYIFYTYLPNHKLRKFATNLIRILAITLLPFVIVLSLLEVLNYPNYIFSHYHVDPHSLQIFGLFISIQFFINVISDKKWIFLVNKYKDWVIVIFSIAFSIFLLGGNLKARWSFVDQKINLFEIPSLISKTEVSKWGESVRYRPSYYFLRIFESYVWRGNLYLWYIARIAFLAYFLFVLVKIISEKLSLLAGFAVAVFVMTSSYWPEILVKLGPAETYGVLGLSIYAYSFYKIFQANSVKRSSIFWWIGILFGGLISAGSKENLIIFILPSIYLLFKCFNYKNIDLKFIFPLFHVLYSLFIGIGIYIAVSKTGHDVYMNVITFKDRWLLFKSNIPKTFGLFFVKDFIEITLIIYLWQLRRIPFNKFLSKTKNIIFFLAFLFFAYLSQVVYYGGGFPGNSRYDFPAILIKQVFIITGVGGLFNLLISMKGKVKKLSKGSLVILSIYVIFNFFNSGFGSIFSYIEKNVVMTNNFSSHLDLFVKVTSENPDYPVIFRSRRIWDYEHVFSIYRYINFLGVKNDLYLDYEDKDFETKKGLEQFLSKTLIDISKNGMSNERLNFKPYVPKTIETNCIDYNMSYIKESSGCIKITD